MLELADAHGHMNPSMLGLKCGDQFEWIGGGGILQSCGKFGDQFEWVVAYLKAP